MSRKTVALILLTALGSACIEWQAAPVSGPTITADDVPSQVRVTRADGTRVVLKDAVVRSDSIAGVEDSGAPARVDLSDVQMLETGQVTPAVVLVPALIVIFTVVPRVLGRSLRNTDSTGTSGGS